MRSLRFLIPFSLFAAFMGMPALHAADNPSVMALHQLFQSEWDRNMRENPLYASDLGDRRYNDRWSDVSLTAVRKYHAEDVQALKQLEKINRAALPPGIR